MKLVNTLLKKSLSDWMEVQEQEDNVPMTLKAKKGPETGLLLVFFYSKTNTGDKTGNN